MQYRLTLPLTNSSKIPESSADHHKQPGADHQTRLDQSGASGVSEGELLRNLDLKMNLFTFLFRFS